MSLLVEELDKVIQDFKEVIEMQALEIFELKKENQYQLEMHQDLLGQIAKLKTKKGWRQ